MKPTRIQEPNAVKAGAADSGSALKIMTNQTQAAPIKMLPIAPTEVIKSRIKL
jgi:hypothetical protein